MTQTIRLGPFEVGERLGEGGMGAVYRARHCETGVVVAVKLIRGSMGEDARQRFHREVQAHAGLLHPGVVYLFEYGVVSEEAALASGHEFVAQSPFVAMELADRGTVRELLPLSSWNSVRGILTQVLDALAFAHARRVIHRDLKPENLLVFGDVGEQPRIKLADFGIAHAVGQESEHTTQALSSTSGTPFYMAPEQAHGRWREYGPWTDLYALGCMAWEMVCGHPPFKGNSAVSTMLKHHIEERPPLAARFPVPDELEAWIHRSMAVDPRHRFRRAAEAARALPGAVDPAIRASTRQSGVEHVGTLDTLDSQLQDDVGLADTIGPTLAATRIEFAAPTVQRQGSAPLGTSEPRQPGCAPFADRDQPAQPIPPTWKTGQFEDLPSLLVGTGLGLFGLRETPFVDREAERDQIWQALREVEQTGEPRVVLIVGESGAGKSRLVDWMTTRAHELGAANLLRAVHSAGVERLAEGLPEMVRQAVRGHRLARGEFYEHLLDTLPPLDDAEIDHEVDARALTELVYPTDDNAETVDGPRYRFSSQGQKAALLARFIHRFGHQRPPLVWLDDAQWGDSAMLLTKHLLESSLDRPPALVAVTLRADVLAEDESLRDRVETLTAHPWCACIDLEPLQAADHREFVGRMLPLEEELANRLAQRTEGNPLFATQLLGHLVDRDHLEAASDGFRLTEGMSLDLPDNIHALWIRRLRRLIADIETAQPESIWKAIETAAALGREVDAAEWRAVCEELNIDISDRLRDVLVARGLAARTDRGWAFAHGLLVDSIERRAREKGRWQEHHRRCAELLERIYSAQPAQTAARRAEHWLEADEPERAIAPLLEESDRLRRTGNSKRRCDVIERRERALDAIGAADDDPRRIEDYIILSSERILGTYGLQKGGSNEILESMVEARKQAKRHGNDRLVAKAWRMSAMVLRQMGDRAKARLFDQHAVDLARDCGDEDLLLNALTGLGWTEEFSGELDSAEARFTEALRRATNAGGYPYWEMEARRGLAWNAVSRGKHRRATALFEGIVEQSRDAGYRYIEASALNGLGEIARYRGDSERARFCYQRYRELSREVNRAADVAASYLNLGHIELMAGQFDAASEQFVQAQKRFKSIGLEGSVVQDHFRIVGLTSAAGLEEWSQFDSILESYADGWPEGAKLEVDIPWLLEMAGDYAANSGERERASRVWDFARELWERLDNEEAAERLAEKLGG